MKTNSRQMSSRPSIRRKSRRAKSSISISLVFENSVIFNFLLTNANWSSLISMTANKEYEESSCHYESDNPAETTSLPSTPTTSSVVYRINRFRSRCQIMLLIILFILNIIFISEQKWPEWQFVAIDRETPAKLIFVCLRLWKTLERSYIKLINCINKSIKNTSCRETSSFWNY